VIQQNSGWLFSKYQNWKFTSNDKNINEEFDRAVTQKQQQRLTHLHLLLLLLLLLLMMVDSIWKN